MRSYDVSLVIKADDRIRRKMDKPGNKKSINVAEYRRRAEQTVTLVYS